MFKMPSWVSQAKKPSLSVSHVIFFALKYLFSALLYLSSALCHVKTTFLLANQNDGIC